jgi:hypothetical protein
MLSTVDRKITHPQIQIIKPWPLVSKKLKYKAREITASHLLSRGFSLTTLIGDSAYGEYDIFVYTS